MNYFIYGIFSWQLKYFVQTYITKLQKIILDGTDNIIVSSGMRYYQIINKNEVKLSHFTDASLITDTEEKGTYYFLLTPWKIVIL